MSRLKSSLDKVAFRQNGFTLIVMDPSDLSLGNSNTLHYPFIASGTNITSYYFTKKSQIHILTIQTDRNAQTM